MRRKRPIPEFLPPGLRAFRHGKTPMRRAAATAAYARMMDEITEALMLPMFSDVARADNVAVRPSKPVSHDFNDVEAARRHSEQRQQFRRRIREEIAAARSLPIPQPDEQPASEWS